MSITCYPDKSYPDTCIPTLSLQKYMWHWILWHLFPDIQCSVTIESRHLFPRHLFPQGIKTPVSWHLFPQGIKTPVSRHLFPKGIKTPVSRHLFPTGNKTPVSRHLFPTGIKTPVSRHLFPRAISWHLFPPKKSRHLFPNTCFPPKNQTPVSGQLKSKDWQKNLVKMRAKGFESMVLLFDQYVKWTVNFWYNLCFYFGDLHIVWSHIKARNPNIFFKIQVAQLRASRVLILFGWFLIEAVPLHQFINVWPVFLFTENNVQIRN